MLRIWLQAFYEVTVHIVHIAMFDNAYHNAFKVMMHLCIKDKLMMHITMF